MSFNALVQDGKVYLVPASLEVPVARRNALLPAEVLGSWAQVPAAVAVPAPTPAPAPAPAPTPVVAATVPAPAPAPVASVPASEPTAPLPEVKEQSGERRKGR